MGWGSGPHEGYMARRLTEAAAAANTYPLGDDRRWTAVWSYELRGTTGWQARCSCGWRSGMVHGHDDPEHDNPGEELEERLHMEWRDTHMAPLIDPEPDRVLVLGEDEGGRRHFLAGRPVNAGTRLELRLADDLWVPVRYEWSWSRGRRPRAYLALGGRGEDVGPEWGPGVVDFELPESAELRWPAEARRERW